MGTAAFDITSTSATAWQLAGALRVSLDRDKRAVLDANGKPTYDASNVLIEEEIYLKTVSMSRFRDHENVTDIETIFSDADASSGYSILASFQGSSQVNVNLSSEYDAENPTSGSSVWYLQDTSLEPMESQGSFFIRENQEWTAQLPAWVVAPWQTTP